MRPVTQWVIETVLSVLGAAAIGVGIAIESGGGLGWCLIAGGAGAIFGRLL